uniref:Large ribosomal subunit protein bL32c n=1 Tax=Dicloster acuatus TaxID=91190 RepID=A0A097KQH5_9CHLO|nr:ribosomal protein L32 [Dicloster acuatus]AIT95438.1 ribosomal protein L32 [Dicloster acuatus]
MAVPKKRTSKSKKNLRKTQWKLKASVEAKKALGKAKLVLNNLLKKQVAEIAEIVDIKLTEE